MDRVVAGSRAVAVLDVTCLAADRLSWLVVSANGSTPSGSFAASESVASHGRMSRSGDESAGSSGATHACHEFPRRG
jgi:hypothetical protein